MADSMIDDVARMLADSYALLHVILVTCPCRSARAAAVMAVFPSRIVATQVSEFCPDGHFFLLEAGHFDAVQN